MPDRYPQRIVCLTEETTETPYLLGEGDRIVPTVESLTDALERTLHSNVRSRARSVGPLVQNDGAQVAARRLVKGDGRLEL